MRKMKKKRKYSVLYDSPLGRCQADADSLNELICALGAARSVLAETSPDMGLEAKAKYVMGLYYCERTKSNNRGISPIAEAGNEIDLIKCYLRGFNITDTVEWLRIEKQLKTSISAVGRYWTVLGQLPITAKIKVSKRQ